MDGDWLSAELGAELIVAGVDLAGDVFTGRLEPEHDDNTATAVVATATVEIQDLVFMVEAIWL